MSPKIGLYGPVKRLLDVLFSLIGLAAALPVTVLVFLLNRLGGDTEGLFFTQTRVGKNGRPFKLIKFRTMVPHADLALEKLLEDPVLRAEWAANQKLKSDPRITPLGHFLRNTSLDEFPQFWNVLKGDMSVIGPRPLVPGELEAHGGDARYQSLRPGVSGWWACNGRSDTDYAGRLELEYYYVDHVSFLLDVKCFFKTAVLVLLRPNGC